MGAQLKSFGAGLSKDSSVKQSAKPSAAKPSGTSSPSSSDVKAAMDYMNAANYYNQAMATMMMASAGSSNTSTEAYLNAYAATAASYNNLIKTLPNSISVTKPDKKVVGMGSGNKPQSPSSKPEP